MSFHTPPHKHVGDEDKPGQLCFDIETEGAMAHMSASDNIPSPTGRLSKSDPEWQEFPKPWPPSPVVAALRKERTNGYRLLETFAGAAACKLWWPTDNGR